MKNKFIKKIDDENPELIYLKDYLNEIERTVIPQLEYTVNLFPEFTPHNYKLHISNLFNLANNILRENIIDELNSVEIFILINAIYCHDWGMAFSNSQLIDLKENKKESNDKSETKVRYNKYINENAIIDITNDEVSNFVRINHHHISKERIRDFYGNKDKSLGRIIGEVCESHGLEISEIERFSEKDTVCGKIINVKALSIFIRLIDLLDLGNNRTPVQLWKFINPYNLISNQEWKKHLSTNPPAFELIENKIRKIIIKSETDEFDVYYKLNDLKKYVQEQIDTSVNFLSRFERYYFIILIDWHITPTGFDPTLIRFELDKKNIHQLLRDQVYGNDNYVFLRELIQNSIDAIKVKKEVISNIDTKFKEGKICIKINSHNNRPFEFSIQDNGIGMDEYVLKNYFSVIGKSFYSKENMEKKGLKFDPISKFGIGVLSCFKVTDRIKVETKKYASSKKYKIEITGYDNYFNIQSTDENDLIASYTKIQFLIDHNKINKETLKSIILEIIYKESSKVQFMIDDAEIELKSKKEKTQISCNGSTYILEEEQYLNNIRHNREYYSNFFSLHEIRIKKDFNTFQIDGLILFLFPIDIYNMFSASNLKEKEAGIKIGSNTHDDKNLITWHTDNEKDISISNSVKYKRYSRMYFKNILIPEPNYYLTNNQFIHPFVKINIQPFSQNYFDVSLNRNVLDIDNKAQLTKSINHLLNSSLTKYLLANLIDEKNQFSRLVSFSIITTFITIDELLKVKNFDSGLLPILYVDKSGKMRIDNLSNLNTSDNFLEIPRGALNNIFFESYSDIIKNRKEESILVNKLTLGEEFNFYLPYLHLERNLSHNLKIEGLIHNYTHSIFNYFFKYKGYTIRKFNEKNIIFNFKNLTNSVNTRKSFTSNSNLPLGMIDYYGFFPFNTEHAQIKVIIVLENSFSHHEISIRKFYLNSDFSILKIFYELLTKTESHTYTMKDILSKQNWHLIYPDFNRFNSIFFERLYRTISLLKINGFLKGEFNINPNEILVCHSKF